jgi:hypothetical protein
MNPLLIYSAYKFGKYLGKKIRGGDNSDTADATNPASLSGDKSIDPLLKNLQDQAGTTQAKSKELSGMGNESLAPVLDYFKKLVGGDQQELMAATRPERARVIDQYDTARKTIDYYERMAKSSGGLDQVRANSSRVFLVPGMGHCTTGVATLDRFDLLQAVVDWVEQNRAPEMVTATGRAFPGRSRPLCAYPQYAAYKGQGDAENAESFECRD